MTGNEYYSSHGKSNGALRQHRMALAMQRIKNRQQTSLQRTLVSLTERLAAQTDIQQHMLRLLTANQHQLSPTSASPQATPKPEQEPPMPKASSTATEPRVSPPTLSPPSVAVSSTSSPTRSLATSTIPPTTVRFAALHPFQPPPPPTFFAKPPPQSTTETSPTQAFLNIMVRKTPAVALGVWAIPDAWMKREYFATGFLSLPLYVSTLSAVVPIPIETALASCSTHPSHQNMARHVYEMCVASSNNANGNGNEKDKCNSTSTITGTSFTSFVTAEISTLEPMQATGRWLGVTILAPNAQCLVLPLVARVAAHAHDNYLSLYGKTGRSYNRIVLAIRTGSSNNNNKTTTAEEKQMIQEAARHFVTHVSAEQLTRIDDSTFLASFPSP